MTTGVCEGPNYFNCCEMALKALRLARRAKELVRTDTEGNRRQKTVVAARLQIRKAKTTYERRHHAFTDVQKTLEKDASNSKAICQTLAEAEAVLADLG